MGMEGVTPEPVVPEEPTAPDESQRVDDVEKAQLMAELSNSKRSEAADNRKLASGETPIKDTGDVKIAKHGEVFVSRFDRNVPDEVIRNIANERAKTADQKADETDKWVGEAYDEEKKKANKEKLGEVKKSLGME